MKAILLAGGFGKRLHPLTQTTPKPLLPLVGKPVVSHILDRLYAAGVREIIVSVNQAHAEKLKEALGDGSAYGMKLSYFVEPSTCDNSKPGAVGALNLLSPLLDKESEYIVAGADNFAPDFDFGQLLREHRKSGAVVTLGLNLIHNERELETLGVVKVKSDGRVEAFQEKPKGVKPISNLANTAFFVVTPEFFKKTERFVAEEKAAGRKPDNLGAVFEKMLVWGDHIHSHTYDGLWVDVGKPHSYLIANKHVVKKVCKGEGAIVDWSAKIHPTARLEGTSIIEGNVRVGRSSVINGGSHIMENAEIGNGCVIEGSLIFPNAKLCDNCKVSNAIVTGDSVVPTGYTVQEHGIFHAIL